MKKSTSVDLMDPQTDGHPRRWHTSAAGSIAHYQWSRWVISEQWDPVTVTNKHILSLTIKLPNNGTVQFICVAFTLTYNTAHL